MGAASLRFSTLACKTVVVHTATYFVAGILAYTLGNYEGTFAEPPLSHFMRPTTDPWVMAGHLFQPIRGLIFALAFFPLREVLFARKNGWLFPWWAWGLWGSCPTSDRRFTQGREGPSLPGPPDLRAR